MSRLRTISRLRRVAAATVFALAAWSVLPGAATASSAPYPTWAPGVPPPPLPAATNGANLAPLPPMGWNDWAHYGCTTNNPYQGHVGPSESLFHTVADNLVSSGLAAKGYKTVTVDDCWMTPGRDANGNMITDTTKFPGGMKALGDYFHADGLKYGIYNDAGTATCTGQAGSAGNFQTDATLFASFGVDYVKTDGCNVSRPSGETQLQAYQAAYAQMSQGIASTGRPMAFSESEPAYFYIGVPSPRSDWYTSLASSQGTGQLWREGNDTYMWTPSTNTGDGWGYVKTNYDYNWPLARYSEPNSFNDPDFLLTGDNSLTVDEQKSQFALWSIMAAPLIVSSNASALLDPTTQSILGNTGIVAVDQDPLGAAATVVSRTGTADLLARPLANGDRAFALFNTTGSAQTLTTTLAQIGYTTAPQCSYSVTDLWAGTSTTANAGTTISASLPANGTAIYRVSSPFGCGSATPATRIVGPIGGNFGCVAVSSANAAVPAACNGTPAQRFALYGDGTIRNGASCLTATGGGTRGNPVQLASCTGATTQQWTYGSTGNLTNTSNALCLDDFGGLSGTWLDTWTCGASQNNQVVRLPVSQATGEVHGLTLDSNDGTCLTTLNGATAVGTAVVSSACNGSAVENWVAPGDGTLRLAGLCLQDPNSGGSQTQQTLGTCTGSANQTWSYDTVGNLVNAANSLCLDIFASQPSNNTEVDVFTCGYNQANQLWALPQ